MNIIQSYTRIQTRISIKPNRTRTALRS